MILALFPKAWTIKFLQLYLLQYRNELVFASGVHFYPSLIYVDRARSISVESHKGLYSGKAISQPQSGAPKRCFT